MEKTQLVFVPVPGTGHIVSMLEFAKCLIERDQRLSIMILLMGSPFSPTTGSFSQLVAASNSNIRFIDLPQIDPPSKEYLKSLHEYFSIYIKSYKSHVKDAIINHVLPTSNSLVGLVVDYFCTSMIDVADELGVPSYVFFTSCAAYLGLLLYLPVYHSKVGTEFNLSDPDSIVPAYSHPLPSSVLPSFLFDKNGGYTTYVYHATRLKETKGIFINTFAELEPHPVKSIAFDNEMPPIYTVGPLINLEGQKQHGHNNGKILKWLDDQPTSSVVFLCFGSLGSFEPPQLAEIAIALEQSGQRFLWSVRRPLPKEFIAIPAENTDFSELLPQGFLERTQNRGLVCGWAPQVEVLAHEAVGGFVSHCGWNSILESLWHRVPIATWPLYAEQQTNAFQLVKELELAVELTLDYRVEIESARRLVTADEIENAIRCLMDAENPVRKRVKEMSEISRKACVDGGSSSRSMRRLISDIFFNKL